VFVIGVLMIVAALAMVVAGIAVPVDAARPGLIGGALGVGIGGLVLAYLDAPKRRQAPSPGSVRAKRRSSMPPPLRARSPAIRWSS
jgi:hypothetical protein